MCPVYKNKQGMGLVPIIMAIVIGATLITSATAWLLSLNSKISNIDGQLEAMTVATTEWNRLNAMSMEDLEKNVSSLTDYKVGEYQVMVNLGDKGHMKDGTCKTTGLTVDDKLNCYNDSKITIRKDNKTLYTSRLMPLATQKDVLTNKDITVISGVVSSGQQIPIPEGYTEDECTFFVSTYHAADGVSPDDIYSFSTYIEGKEQQEFS